MKWGVFWESAKSSFWWFTLKFLLGVIVTYAVANWIKFSNGGVTFYWAVYVVGAASFTLLFFLSDVRDDYRRRTGYSTRKGKSRGRRN